MKVHELNMPHITTKGTPLPYSDDTCTGYARRVRHDEIADAVGLNLKEIPRNTGSPEFEGRGDNSMPRKRAKSESVVA